MVKQLWFRTAGINQLSMQDHTELTEGAKHRILTKYYLKYLYYSVRTMDNAEYLRLASF